VGNARVLRHLPGGLKRPDAAGLARAVEAFLRASGVDLSDPNLRDTPRRVSQAWIEDFLDGYARDPAEVLGKTYPAPAGSEGELVVLTDLTFHSMCPHHLLPYTGRAHIAYMPSQRVVGFGRIAELLNCFAHRLVLQENLARLVVQALAEHLGSAGTACVLEAEQACLRLRGHSQQRRATTHAEAYTGALRRNKALRAELWARIPSRRG
jgi:GTP cyclohydrolase IA